MPEGPLGFPRLTSIGPFVESEWSSPVIDYEISSDVYFHSSEDMPELDDGSVHLSVTSPPYNIGWDYGEGYGDSLEKSEYFQLLDSVFDECYRVLEEQGRLCVVVPDLVREGAEGGTSQLRIVMDVLRSQNNDWRFREVIIWNKAAGRIPDYSTFPEPWGVLLNNIHESIIVAQKPGRRRGYERPSDEIRQESVYSNPPRDVTTDVWRIPVQESFVEVNGQRVPTYPEEIPRRLIKLYSYKTDTVLDPFAGVGTTLKAAIQEDRNAVGYEIREELSGRMRREIPIDMEER